MEDRTGEGACPALWRAGLLLRTRPLTVCCSRPGARVPASRRNCTAISRTDTMSSRRPLKWGRRARRRSQLAEIRLLRPDKRQMTSARRQGCSHQNPFDGPGDAGRA